MSYWMPSLNIIYIINVKIKMRNSTANSDYITLQKVVVEVCKSQLRSHFMLF